MRLGPRGIPSRSVYLRRGGTGVGRVLANEDALIDRLVDEGFDIVELEGSSVRDLAAGLAGARRVVSVEGSHINHVYFLAPAGVSVLALIPDDRFSLVHSGRSRGFGARFGFSVIRNSENGYRVDADAVLRTLDLMEP